MQAPAHTVDAAFALEPVDTAITGLLAMRGAVVVDEETEDDDDCDEYDDLDSLGGEYGDGQERDYDGSGEERGSGDESRGGSYTQSPSAGSGSGSGRKPFFGFFSGK